MLTLVDDNGANPWHAHRDPPSVPQRNITSVSDDVSPMPQPVAVEVGPSTTSDIITISNTTHIANNRANEVRSGTTFIIPRAAIERGLMSSVNTWLKSFPKGTRFAVQFRNENVTPQAASLQFVKGGKLDHYNHIGGSAIRFPSGGISLGVGGDFRITVKIPSTSASIGGSDTARTDGVNLAQDPVKLLALQISTVQRMLNFIEQSNQAAQFGYQLDPELKTMASEARLDPIVLDVLRFIVQSRGGKPHDAFAVRHPKRLNKELSENLSLHADVKTLLREAIQRYQVSDDDIELGRKSTETQDFIAQSFRLSQG